MTTLQAGTGKVDITPPVGVMLQGYARESGSTGIFERLYAKALVFDNGREKAALITSDLIAISPELAAAVRKGIVKAVRGISGDHIMVAASHTHCGPVILPNLIGQKGLDREYIRGLREKLITLVVDAFKTLEPVRIGTGSGKAFFNINRRLPTKDGLLFAPNPKGVCDHEVGVVRIDGVDGRPRAILMNFSCHPTVMGGDDISPDYPGFAQKTVEAAYRGEVVALFTTGTCGDVRPYFKGKDPRSFGGGTRAAVKQAGTVLGREVIRVARAIRTRETADLAATSTIVRLPLEKPRSIASLRKEIDECQARLRQFKKEGKGFLFCEWEQGGITWVRNTIRLIERKQFKPWVEGEIQLLRFGGISLVALPGEVMCEIGMNIKRHFGSRKCFLSTVTNGCVGYIPTAEALTQGGYEPNDSIRYFRVPARFSGHVGDVILKTVEKLDDRLLC